MLEQLLNDLAPHRGRGYVYLDGLASDLEAIIGNAGKSAGLPNPEGEPNVAPEVAGSTPAPAESPAPGEGGDHGTQATG